MNADELFVTEASTFVDDPAVALESIRRPATWPEWQSEIVTTRGPRVLAEGDHVTGDARMLGFAVGGRADVTSVGNASLEQDVLVGIRMRVGYTIVPEGEAWRLTHRLAVDLPMGVSGRVLSFFLKRRLRRMQTELLAALAARHKSSLAESG